MGDDREPTVLIVDDEPDILMLIRVELEMAGLDVVAEAVDGPGAVAVFDRLDPPPIPHVVVLDNRMPGLTGVEVAQQLVERVPAQRIVLFSAFVDDELIERAIAAGVRQVVSKGDIARLPMIVRDVASI